MLLALWTAPTPRGRAWIQLLEHLDVLWVPSSCTGISGASKAAAQIAGIVAPWDVRLEEGRLVWSRRIARPALLELITAPSSTDHRSTSNLDNYSSLPQLREPRMTHPLDEIAPLIAKLAPRRTSQRKAMRGRPRPHLSANYDKATCIEYLGIGDVVLPRAEEFFHALEMSARLTSKDLDPSPPRTGRTAGSRLPATDPVTADQLTQAPRQGPWPALPRQESTTRGQPHPLDGPRRHSPPHDLYLELGWRLAGTKNCASWPERETSEHRYSDERIAELAKKDVAE